MSITSIVTIDKVSKSYGERILFKNISFTIEENDKIGLIGINGTGKSTLLNLIAGVEFPDSGTVQHSHNLNIGYLEQNPESDSQVSVLEQVLQGDAPVMKAIRKYESILGDITLDPDNPMLQDALSKQASEINALKGWELESQVKTILTRLGINNFELPMGTLSGGQKKRVALASTLLTPCDLLLLDEPTNHLDNNAIEWLENYLINRKGALLMITHDRYFLDRVVNKIIELDQGKIYTYPGAYSYFLEKKMERKAIEAAWAEKQQSLYKKELEWIRTGARARSTKQKARIKRFQELQDSIIKLNDEDLEISLGYSRLGRQVMEIESVTKSFENGPVISDFSYILRRNDRIGVIGENGIGKSTLLNLLAGKLVPDSGQIKVGSTVKIAFLSQEGEELNHNMRALEYIKDTAEYITAADGSKISAAKMAEKFLFPADMQWTHISKLSGGEKRRLNLLKVLMEAPNVLLLDEPTNDLDVDTLQVLENYIENFQGAVIAASHDRYFLDKTCHRIFSFEGSGKIVEHTGNYSDFLEFKKLIQAENTKNKPVKNQSQNNKPKPEKLKFTYKEEQEYKNIVAEIQALEEQIAEIDKQMEQLNSDYIKLQELYANKEKLEEELLFKLERLDYLSDLEKKIIASKQK